MALKKSRHEINKQNQEQGSECERIIKEKYQNMGNLIDSAKRNNIPIPYK